MPGHHHWYLIHPSIHPGSDHIYPGSDHIYPGSDHIYPGSDPGIWDVGIQDLAMISVFILGYAGIIFEEALAFNKSGVALLMAVSLWVIRSLAV